MLVLTKQQSALGAPTHVTVEGGIAKPFVIVCIKTITSEVM